MLLPPLLLICTRRTRTKFGVLTQRKTKKKTRIGEKEKRRVYKQVAKVVSTAIETNLSAYVVCRQQLAPSQDFSGSALYCENTMQVQHHMPGCSYLCNV